MPRAGAEGGKPRSGLLATRSDLLAIRAIDDTYRCKYVTTRASVIDTMPKVRVGPRYLCLHYCFSELTRAVYSLYIAGRQPLLTKGQDETITATIHGIKSRRTSL